MRISNTGFLTPKYNNNNKKTNNQFSLTQTDVFLQAKNNTPTFKGNFFNFDKIKKLFESQDEKKLKVLPSDQPIDIETAKKLVKLELKNNNELKIEEKVCGKLEKLEKSLKHLTPEIVKIYTTIWMLKEGIEFTLEKYDLDPTKEIKHFFNKDGKIDTLLWEKFQHYAKEAIAEKDYYSQKPLFLMEVLPCCKDKNGIHPEVLDLFKTKSIEYIRENHLKKNNVTNLELVKLLQYLDNTDRNDSFSVLYTGAVNCAWNKKDEPDLNAIAAIKTMRDKLRWGLAAKDCRQLFYYIENAKDKNGNYDREYDKYFKKIIANGVKLLSVVPTMVDISRINKKESNKNLSKKKLQIITDAITNIAFDDNFSSNATLNNFVRLIDGNETRVQAYSKLYDLLFKNIGYVNTAFLNEFFELTIDKQDKIPTQAKTIINDCMRLLKHGRENSVIDLIKIIKLPNDKLDIPKYNTIVQNYKKTNNNAFPIIELAKVYYTALANKLNINFSFDEFVDVYISLYDKIIVNYNTQDNNMQPEHVPRAYGNLIFLEEYLEIIQMLLNNNKFDIKNIQKTTEVAQDVGFFNVHSLFVNLGDLDSRQVKEFLELLNLAKQNKQTLREGIDDLSDKDINDAFCSYAKYIHSAYKTLGKDVIFYAFKLKLDDFIDFCCNFSGLETALKNSNDTLYQQFLEKFSPQNSERYNDAVNIVTNLKQRLYGMVSPEQRKLEIRNKTKIKDLQAELSGLKKQLNTDLANVSLKGEIARKIKEIKTLNQEIQQYYKQEKFSEIIKEINEKSNIIAHLESAKISDYEEIINHVKNLSVLVDCFEQQDCQYYLNTLNNNQDSQIRLVDFIQEKIFQKLDIKNTEVSKRYLDFSKSKYISQLLQERVDLVLQPLKLIYKELEKNKDKPKEEVFDSLPQNIETRSIFKKLGINYKKWVSTDKSSYVSVNISTDLEKAKSSIIKNLEEDFNSPYWDMIPQNEFQKILDAMKESGFELKSKNKILYDDDGCITGEKTWKALLKNGNPIVFADVHNLINIIKDVMNKENYWNTDIPSENGDMQVTSEQMAKQTLLTHIMKMRDKEVMAIKGMNSNETTSIEVHKTDMNDIVHSLFLGNHACCCTAIGNGCNSWSAPLYVMNKCISSIEVMDGKNFVGNTMCYIAHVDGELALILDNIELNPKYQYNDKIRDAIFEYAEKMCAEIGKPDMRIYAGSLRHKVNMDKYPIKNHKFVLQGSTNNESVYVDFLSGFATFKPADKIGFTRLYQIK